jgi:hypothetical protein
MKKLFVIAALSLASVSAFASKARLQALGNSAHLIDTQTIFTNPADLATMGDWATFEFGNNAMTYTPPSGNAINVTGNEGGVVRSHGDSRWGLYLGHHSSTVALSRSNAYWGGVGTMLLEENPFEIFFAQKADVSWGASLFYSNSDKKSTSLKQDTMGLRVGARASVWDAYLNFGLANNAKDETAVNADLKGKTSFKLGGGYYFDTLYVYANYGMSGFKTTVGGTDAADLEGSQAAVGVVDTMKKDGNDFFYGVAYHMDSYKEKVSDKKSEATYLPVIIGVESEATSWMVLRASVTQNLLLGTVKDEITIVTGAATTDANTWNNSTTVAAGAGLKFNKFTFDGTLAAAGNGGNFNANNLLANASMTYMF